MSGAFARRQAQLTKAKGARYWRRSASPGKLTLVCGRKTSVWRRGSALLDPRRLQDLDLRIEHLPLHRPRALGRGDRRFEDFLHDAHALCDMAEGGEAIGISAGT